MKNIFTLILIISCLSLQARRHYVNINAKGANDGTSWVDAFTELSVPMDNNAYIGDTFWVANGTYTGHVTTEPWSFHLLGGTVLYGGFDGSETLLSQRNYSQHLTILAGTNSYLNAIIIAVPDTFRQARIDGFRITHLSSKSTQATIIGISVNGSFTLENCLVTNIACQNIFYLNNFTLNPAQNNIINCQFIGNEYNTKSTLPSALSAGALLCTGNGAHTIISDCLFKNNLGGRGGAISLTNNTRATLNRCVFYGNEATLCGGALYDTLGASFRAFNCVFVGNKAYRGSVHYAGDTISKHAFAHCTFAHNYGWGVLPNNYALNLKGNFDSLRNCILWGDSSGTSPEISNPKGSSVFSRNIIRGGGTLFGTSGTITADPLFAKPGTASQAPFQDTTSFDYHVSALSVAIDTGANLGLVAPFDRDLESNARFQGRWPDLGAYEWKSCNWVNVKITASGPLNFCQPDSVKLTASANPLYNHVFQWNNGSYTGTTITAKTTGLYKVVVVDSTGCQSSSTVNVNAVATPTPVISRTGNTMSVPASYATYQWYKSGTAIYGATAPSYSTTIAGQYTIGVTTSIAHCPGTSSTFNFAPVGLSNISQNVALNIFPNPSSGLVNLKLESVKPSQHLKLSIQNLTGALVWSNEFNQIPANFETTLDLEQLPTGVYLLQVQGDEWKMVRKVVLQ